MPDDPSTPPQLPRRGGLWAGLRAGARAVWRGLMTEIGGKPPRVMRTVRSWEEWIALLPMVLWIVYFTLNALFRMSPTLPLFLTLLGSYGATVVIQFAFWLKVRRMRAHAARLNYRICPECGYSLANLAPEGTCPECGTAYTPEELEVVWKRR